jgi:hypothetical protein
MSAAACWEESSPKLPIEISKVLDASGDQSITSLELLAAMPEWEVELPGGDRPSQTDVLAVARNTHGLVIIGVEAKVDEPFGPTLGEKRENASSGQLERISYLERELGCTSSLHDSIRYQLLHRTVSAILTARAFHAKVGIMLVQSFSQTSRWREDFEALAKAVNAQRIADDLYEVVTVAGIRLMIGWCTGDKRFLSAELPSGI